MTMIVLGALVIPFAAATARLFVWPVTGVPDRVDAVLMLDRRGNPVSAAVHLAQEHHARFLVISLGAPHSGYGCPPPVPGVELICFNPAPATTQGEAEFAGRLARKHHWHSLALVTITPQASRARLRTERCFQGPVYVATTPIALTSWPYEITYEWGATIKALVFQRHC